jgi:hypothetical protein
MGETLLVSCLFLSFETPHYERNLVCLIKLQANNRNSHVKTICHIYGRREILLNGIVRFYQKVHLYILLKNCFNLAKNCGYSAYQEVLTFKSFTICPQSACMCCVWFSEKREWRLLLYIALTFRFLYNRIEVSLQLLTNNCAYINST